MALNTIQSASSAALWANRTSTECAASRSPRRGRAAWITLRRRNAAMEESSTIGLFVRGPTPTGLRRTRQRALPTRRYHGARLERSPFCLAAPSRHARPTRHALAVHLMRRSLHSRDARAMAACGNEQCDNERLRSSCAARSRTKRGQLVFPFSLVRRNAHEPDTWMGCAQGYIVPYGLANKSANPCEGDHSESALKKDAREPAQMHTVGLPGGGDRADVSQGARRAGASGRRLSRLAKEGHLASRSNQQ